MAEPAEWGIPRERGLGALGYLLGRHVFGGKSREEAERAKREQEFRDILQMGSPSRSSVLQGQEQPGPVQAEPSFEIPGLAEQVFSGPSAGIPFSPDRPERARSVYGPPLPHGGTFDRSGEFAVPPEDDIPEFLRRPESTEAASSAFTPGGERVSRVQPGRTAAEILTERPELTRTYLQAQPTLAKIRTEEAEARKGGMEAADEAAGRKATQDFLNAKRNGVPEEDAYAQYGAVMEQSEVGRKIGEGVRARGTARRAKETDARAAAKEGRDVARETRAQDWAKAQSARLRANADPDDDDLADMLDAAAADPKMAEVMMKHLEAKAKQAEGKKPIVGQEGVLHEEYTDPETGQRRLRPIPGQARKAEKPWYEGKDEKELLGISEDENYSPALRQQARARYERIIADRKGVAAAGVPKPTAVTEKAQQDRFVMTETLREVNESIRAHPEWVGGTGTALKLALAYEAPDVLKGTAAWLANFPRGYTDFRSNLDFFTAEKLNELAGAALTAGEVKRYAAFLPNVYTPLERFEAAVQTSLKMMEAASTYQTAREQGATVQEAQRQARLAIKRVAEEHVREYGDPTVAPARKSEDAANDLKIPRRK